MQIDQNENLDSPKAGPESATISRSFGAKFALDETSVMTRKTRVLAVDDEPVVAEWLADGLKAAHRRVIMAENGRKALSLAAKHKFDVVITDHRMPGSGGLELVRKLRRQKYRGKVIVLSGHLSPENIGIYEELEIDEVLSKPCDIAELREIVDFLEDEDF